MLSQLPADAESRAEAGRVQAVGVTEDASGLEQLQLAIRKVAAIHSMVAMGFRAHISRVRLTASSALRQPPLRTLQNPDQSGLIRSYRSWRAKVLDDASAFAHRCSLRCTARLSGNALVTARAVH